MVNESDYASVRICLLDDAAIKNV